MRVAYKIFLNAILLCYFFVSFICVSSNAQSQFFKFPITESGVYKISQNQLNQVGITGLENISIFGNPGLLPQRLDSLDLTLKEIPTKIIGSELFVYLEGPNIINAQTNDWEYQHHYYTDTVFYLISNQVPTIRIQESERSQNNFNGSLHLIAVKKEESHNLLTSGRNWYGTAFYGNQSYNHSFNIPNENAGLGIVKVKVMAQSLQESRLNLQVNGQAIEDFSIPAIPNTTFGIKGREETVLSNFPIASNATAAVRLTQQSADINGDAFIDYVSIAIPFSNNNLPNGLFYNLSAVPLSISPIAGKELFSISNAYEIKHVLSQTEIKPREKIIVFGRNETRNIPTPISVNLHLRNNPITESLIIVSPESLLSQAKRLANHKNSIGIRSKVVTLNEVFDAFGYGTYDITAIRNFLSYHYLNNGQIKNVLFFGKGTIDYKRKIEGGRPNLVPSYSSKSSLNPLSTYSSDDYYGFLEIGQGEWDENNSGDEILKVGIGRIPAISIQEAREAVDKIIAYETRTENQGDWKRRVAFFADDGDNNIHLSNAESHAKFLTENHPEYIVEKLYLDRYEQVRNDGRQSSPQAKDALKTTIEEGVLILNYVGHGNETTLTAERVFQSSDLRDWVDTPLLPLVVTATCEFGRHDSPYIRSGAEEMLFAKNKGAISLLTTGRPVFSSSNFTLNKAFIEAVFEKENGENLDLGEIFKRTKNNSLNGALNRNFSLLGDPSLKLAIPELLSKVKKVMDIDLEVEIDTLSAMQKIFVRGKIVDPLTESSISNSKGTYKLVLFDRKEMKQTLGDESSPVNFEVEGNILFQGIGNIFDGAFETEIFIPKNISTDFGEGIIRVFATLENNQEAMSAKKTIIGGVNQMITEDTEGPLIEMLFGNKYGEDLTVFSAYNIRLMANLSDESGINISTTNTDQNITLRINDSHPVFLNSFYNSIDNGYKKGRILVPIEGLNEGINTISLEVWDNVGNRSYMEREILVEGSSSIRILKSTTYPNPSIEFSKFKVEHNRTGENLMLHLRVFSILGHEIYRASKRYVKANYILDDLEWIFFHSKTKYPTKGTYIYELELVSEIDNTSDRKSGKIIIK
ncbi:type IX secretion system sortase PorU [Belliella sp. R4-6]|uniref:Type IX secretion system sortase PorU n=1 Tax=Belliella alkalica TaxID=1730871 RepID=A0ABS9VFG6_9BACT|nr:type IX secretion system sortase PorU [Belliella alkalica]MCH7415153.1 type IX secretion system sortase PorU [Belliella alkalica]